MIDTIKHKMCIKAPFVLKLDKNNFSKTSFKLLNVIKYDFNLVLIVNFALNRGCWLEKLFMIRTMYCIFLAKDRGTKMCVGDAILPT